MGSITKVRFLQISLKCLKHHDTKSCTPKCKEDKDLKIKVQYLYMYIVLLSTCRCNWEGISTNK